MNLSQMVHLTITLTVGLSALLISTNLIGKIQLRQATAFHFISALVLGELLGNAVYDPEVSLCYILYSIALWTLLMYMIEIITQKFRRTRGFFEGKPSIIIRNGKIDLAELKKNNMDINEVQRLLREKDVFSVRQVEYGILEPGGTISVLRKWQYGSPTNKDLNLPQKPVFLPISLIADGELLKENLDSLGYDEEWLTTQLKMHNLNKIEDVVYADWQQDEGLHVVSSRKR
ncbi:YetF domain-containing protein [Anaerosolibacter sp.]|uniref:YetF domain-containing protein n=1 Tax=Anaerosolibacter sp. TaxID=1872527 RepID=UPI0039EF3452